MSLRCVFTGSGLSTARRPFSPGSYERLALPSLRYAAARARVDELGELSWFRSRSFSSPTPEQEPAEGALGGCATPPSRPRPWQRGSVRARPAHTGRASPPVLDLIRVPREWAAHTATSLLTTHGVAFACVHARTPRRALAQKNNRFREDAASYATIWPQKIIACSPSLL